MQAGAGPGEPPTYFVALAGVFVCLGEVGGRPAAESCLRLSACSAALLLLLLLTPPTTPTPGRSPDHIVQTSDEDQLTADLATGEP